MDDPFVGSITFVRVYSCTVTSGTGVLNSVKDKTERVGRMLLMHANSREDVKEAFAGDIVALAGLKYSTTGETLCDPNNPVILEKMEFPDPVIEVAIEPRPRPTRKRWAWRWCVWRRRIHPSASRPIRNPARPSSRA